jgi:hypothetical protein
MDITPDNALRAHPLDFGIRTPSSTHTFEHKCRPLESTAEIEATSHNSIDTIRLETSDSTIHTNMEVQDESEPNTSRQYDAESENESEDDQVDRSSTPKSATQLSDGTRRLPMTAKRRLAKYPRQCRLGYAEIAEIYLSMTLDKRHQTAPYAFDHFGKLYNEYRKPVMAEVFRLRNGNGNPDGTRNRRSTDNSKTSKLLSKSPDGIVHPTIETEQ